MRDRWSEGIDHEPESMALIRLMAELDYRECDGGMADLKVGGDGDNGESLAYLLDELIDRGIITITIHKEL